MRISNQAWRATMNEYTRLPPTISPRSAPGTVSHRVEGEAVTEVRLPTKRASPGDEEGKTSRHESPAGFNAGGRNDTCTNRPLPEFRASSTEFLPVGSIGHPTPIPTYPPLHARSFPSNSLVPNTRHESSRRFRPRIPFSRSVDLPWLRRNRLPPAALRHGRPATHPGFPRDIVGVHRHVAAVPDHVAHVLVLALSGRDER